MRIGIAIPCHVDDQAYLSQCMEAIGKLSPQPFSVKVNVNRGESGLKAIREGLFDELFCNGCDVVLSCDADFYLFPSILANIRDDKVTSFAQLERRLVPDIILTGLHLFYNGSWTGCYSLPKQTWEQVVKPSWDGSDSSVKNILGRHYKFVRKPLYYALRCWRSETTKPKLQKMAALKKIRWMALRLAS